MTTKITSVLTLVSNGVRTKQELMQTMNASLASVTGVLAAAKRLGHVEVSDTGLITLTESGKDLLAQPVQPKRINKAALAKDMYFRLAAEGKRRCEIVTAFMEQFGMSKAAASTYLQNAKKANAAPQS